MTAINMGIFNEIANNKADCDLRNIDTNKTDIIIEYQKPTAENGYTWYRLFATSWVEQGGICESELGTSGIITLPIKMNDNNYTAIAGLGNNAGNNTFSISRPEATTTTIKWYKSSTNMASYWIISGRADMTGHEILPQASEGYVSPLELLKQVYPIGSVYMGTQSTCPLASLFGTWELVSSGKALWTGNGTNANTTIEAGLPDHTHGETWFVSVQGEQVTRAISNKFNYEGDGSVKSLTETPTIRNASSDFTQTLQTLNVKNSLGDTLYGSSNTVQPPAYVVNVWRRTA